MWVNLLFVVAATTTGTNVSPQEESPAVFLCYDVHAENAEASGGDDEIASVAWCSLGELKHLEWVSETMHQLAVDGLTQRSALVNQAGLTQRATAYAVYRTGQAKSLDGGWLR